MNSWRVLLVTGVVLTGALAPPSTAHANRQPTVVATATATPTATARATAPASKCDPAERGFSPTRLDVPGVVGPTRVLALGRDRNGVPRTPPLTDAGKWQFGYDRASGTRPGGRHGVVRLNAHTYPWSGDHGYALGNRLLQRLHIGNRLIVTGPAGQQVCYRVTRRQQVTAHSRLHDYYSSTGRSRLAILVCSGTRRGPGDWSHRTIWYAVPTI